MVCVKKLSMLGSALHSCLEQCSLTSFVREESSVYVYPQHRCAMSPVVLDNESLNSQTGQPACVTKIGMACEHLN